VSHTEEIKETHNIDLIQLPVGDLLQPVAERRNTVIQLVTHASGVVKYEGQAQSSQAIELFQAPRKISFTFHSDTSLSSLIM